MSGVEIVVGIAARDAFLATVTASQVEPAGGGQTFASSSYLTGGPVGAFRGILRPNEDVFTGSFTPTPLFSELIESVPDGATSEIISTASVFVAPTSSTDSFEVGLTDPIPLPNANEDVTIRVTAAKTGSAEPTASTVTLTVAVRNGNTDIASKVFELETTYQTFQFTLSEAEKSVAGWNDLSVRCEYELSVASASLEISGSATQIEVEFVKQGIIEAPPKDETVWRIIYD